MTIAEGKKLKGLERFQHWIAEKDLSYTPVMLDDNANTAAQAAAALGCDVAQIAKSLIFKQTSNNKPLLVIASGINRVDEKLIAQVIDSPLARADADFVRQHTGYAIGGVPPFAHIDKIETLVDKDLQKYEVIWAAAGHPKSVLKLTPDDLIQLSEGRVLKVC